MRITTAALLALVSIPAISAPAAANASPTCRTVSAKVAMTSGGSADQRVAGTLCLPRGRTATVQLLIPGGFYGQAYWRMRGDRQRPSYVETMTAAGYATLAIDRLGTGASSYPPSARFGQDTHQIVIRRLIQQLRQGRLGGARFAKVVLVGHSLGSTLARTVAAAHPAEVDGVILTGESSVPDEAAFEQLGAGIHRAADDPRFAGRGLDDGYLTTRPGLRAAWFYHRPNADPEVIAADEATKTTDVFPPGDSYTPPSINKHIQAPVLIVNGEHDKLLAGARTSSAALHAQEAPFYGPRAKLETVVVPGTGHVLNGHRTAPHWFARAREWADRHVGGAAR
ncbi:alpha/beta fold hydrolase [Nonomuraea sp. LP-02]|uniref:alpha/beta hydrolase n=1 Tax=Nonomuraea sp. LP-02 TaxID=3097960 RepID=UPI002E37E9CB|nr:alpha/beta fold hydrolase [Nonomuraea sp. LP-02]MED7931683.1 alpha/beta fold hydrolase [Nonomuraea sp. LP-02]